LGCVHPNVDNSKSSGMFVLVEGSAEMIASADVEVRLALGYIHQDIEVRDHLNRRAARRTSDRNIDELLR
jgi:hypothetical protein